MKHRMKPLIVFQRLAKQLLNEGCLYTRDFYNYTENYIK